MAFRPFEDLRVFQIVERLADRIWDIVLTWNYFARNTVGQQWVDAADSIGANISEGAGRGTPKDNKRFVRISRGSYNETKFWLRRAIKRKLISKEEQSELKHMIDELGPSLNAYLGSIGRGQTTVPKN